MAFRPAILSKRDSDTGFFCEICKVFKNTLLRSISRGCFWYDPETYDMVPANIRFDEDVLKTS